MRPVPDIAAHIRSRLAPPDANGCEVWLGARNARGYGQVKHRGRTHKVHRLRYELEVGPLPDDELVRHKCDNPPCAALGHLVPGSHLDNMADMTSRGRAHRTGPVGEENGASKLTAQQVRAIRVDGRLLREIAVAFGVSKQLVSAIKRGTAWRHLS